MANIPFLNNAYFAAKVGIGTESPIGKLEVQSSVVRTSVNGGADELVLQNAGYSGMTILSSNTTAAQIHFGDDAMSNTGMIQYWNNTNSMVFSTNGGSERMRIDSSGNVGIGTTLPGDKLHVDGGIIIQNGNNLQWGGLYSAAAPTIYGATNYLHFVPTGSTGASGRQMRLDIIGLGIGTSSPSAKLHVAGTGLFTGLVSGITPVAAANFVTKAYVDGSGGGTGPFLPLAGGTLIGPLTGTSATFTGNVNIGSTTSSSTILNLIKSTSGVAEIKFLNVNNEKASIQLDAAEDLQIFANASQQIKLRSGGADALTLDTSQNATFAGDIIGGGSITIGSGGGYNAGVIYSDANWGMIFRAKQASPLLADFLFTDSADVERLRITSTVATFTGSVVTPTVITDNVVAKTTSGNITFKNNSGSTIAQFYNDLSSTFAGNVTVGTGIIKASIGGDIAIVQGSIGLRINDNALALTATTASLNNDNAVSLGTSNIRFKDLRLGGSLYGNYATGTISTNVLAFTQANAINNTTIATTAYVNNKIALIPAGLVFQGTWNASTNTPTLTSGTGTTGNFYIVSVAGSTNLDGITDWKVGDWAVFIEQGASDQWEKIDNSSVLDGIGTGQTLPLWSGSGTSNTLTDSRFTQTSTRNIITGPGTAATDLSVNVKNSAGQVAIQALGTGEVIIPSNYLFVSSSQGAYITGILRARGGITDDGGVLALGGNGLTTNLQLTSGGASGSARFYGSTETTGNVATGPNITAFGNTGNSTLTLQANTGNWTFTNVQASRNLEISDSDGTGTVMTIDTNGNVGIGTTSPGQKLEVIGRTKITQSGGALRINSSDANGSYATWQNNGSNIGYIGAGYHLWSSPNNIATSLGIRAQTRLDLGIQASVHMTILNTGNVGIGTTNPGAKLDVSSDIRTATRYLISTGTTNENMAIGYWDGANARIEAGAALPMLITSYQGNIKLGINGGTTMTVQPTKVGIGTTSPLFKLQTNATITGSWLGYLNGTSATFGTNNFSAVHSSTAIGTGTESGINLANNASDVGAPSPIISFSAKSASAGFQHAYAAIYGIKTATGADTNWNKGDLVFATGQGTGPNERMRINDIGNVGIGTTSPLSQLSIGSNAITTKKPTVVIADGVAGGSLVIRGLSPILSFDRTGANPENKILMDGAGLEFKTGTLDTEGDVDFKIKLDGKLQAPAYTQGFLQSDASGNIEISGGGTLPGGPYLPLVGGTISGNPGTLLISGLSNYTGLTVKGSGASRPAILFENVNQGSLGMIYGTEGNEIVINTNGGNAVTIDSSQNVGIGTTSPGAPLEIYQGGSGKVTLLQLARPNTAGLQSNIQFTVADIMVGQIQHEYEASNLNHMSFTLRAVNGSDIIPLWLENSGNVGIGTTSPSRLLDVDGIQGWSLNNVETAYINPTATGADFALKTSGTTVIRLDGRPNANSFINNGGNVGIGTTSPDRELEVEGNGNVYIRVTASTDTDSSAIELKNTQETWTIRNDDTNDDALEFQSDSGTQVTILKAGNVGIGTTSPTQALEVNGAVLAGDYRGSANIYLTSPDSWIFRSTGGNERMRVTSAGNVGINRTSLVEKFEVGGDSAFYGAIKGYTGSSSNQYLSILQSVQGNTYISTGTSGETINFSTGSTQNVTNINVAGTATATNFILSSDETLKDKIKDIETKHINVEWKNFELISEPGVKRSGVIAQELEEKHPEFVRTDKDGLKSVAYIDLLITKIAELEARLEKAGL